MMMREEEEMVEQGKFLLVMAWRWEGVVVSLLQCACRLLLTLCSIALSHPYQNSKPVNNLEILGKHDVFSPSHVNELASAFIVFLVLNVI